MSGFWTFKDEYGNVTIYDEEPTMTLIDRLCERRGTDHLDELRAADLIGELSMVLSDMVAMLDDMGIQRGLIIDRARAVLDKAGE